jgi:hypothetical protein
VPSLDPSSARCLTEKHIVLVLIRSNVRCWQTITPAPNQMTLGNDIKYAICADPHSQAKYPQYPNCTSSPENWHTPVCLCKLPGDVAAKFNKCAACAEIPPPPPPPPHRHFPLENSTDCTWVLGASYVHRVTVGTPVLQHVGSKQDCCRACYENSECVVSAWHDTAVPVHSCFLHFSSAGGGTAQTGVVGCVTSRDGPDGAL